MAPAVNALLHSEYTVWIPVTTPVADLASQFYGGKHICKPVKAVKEVESQPRRSQSYKVEDWAEDIKLASDSEMYET